MRFLLHIVAPSVLAVLLLTGGCLASGEQPDDNARPVRTVAVKFEQAFAVESSVLSFQLLDTSDRSATGAEVRFTGSLGEGKELDATYFVPVDRVGDDGDLVVRLRVADGLWDDVNPDPRRTLTGAIEIEVEDEIGIFGRGRVESARLTFHDDFRPLIGDVDSLDPAWINDRVTLSGEGILRPVEGTTWAIVESGKIEYPDGTTRRISNARVPVEWTGSRFEAELPLSPEIFGVEAGVFSGNLTFLNHLKTGREFEGNRQETLEISFRPPKVENITPTSGSRGQKITIEGRGFLPDDPELGYGMYLVFEGLFTPRNPEASAISFEGSNAAVRVPFRVVDGTTIEQDVWYSVDSDTGRLTGLGAFPGEFDGTITPHVFDAQGEEIGEPWTGEFEVLPTRQVVHVKYLPGFSRALELYGLQNVEREIRDRVLHVLRRDYDGVNMRFSEQAPEEYIEYTTIEIGGRDPSGLLNFGYDNSFNDGGKDIGNLYLSDYLGGINRHAENAGYLPYGGVFIESFIAFSPSLFPENFGTSHEFDRTMAPFMPGLDGTPVKATEWPDGPRKAAIRNAIDLIGNLTGHTASHEIGHALGLAYFPRTVEGYDERFHNDPAGSDLIMDAGSDRPFDERAEINGKGPARFSAENLQYLKTILPLP